MRVERLGGDKVRFFLTLDDLLDRGIEKEDIWRDIPKMHELFNDMMEQAYEELGFEIAGPLAVEVFALPTQGMVVVVTRGRVSKSELDEYEDGSVYELEVTMEESDHIVFRFDDFEDLIQAAKRIHSMVKQGGQVYAFHNHYYLVFLDDLETDRLESVIAILLEYGEPSTMTDAYLSEYGKVIWAKNAIEQAMHYFGDSS